MTTTEERLLIDGGTLEQIQALLSIAYGNPFYAYDLPQPVLSILFFLEKVGAAKRGTGHLWTFRDIPEKGTLEGYKTTCATCPHHKIETPATIEAGIIWGCKYTPEVLCGLDGPADLHVPQKCPVFNKEVVG